MTVSPLVEISIFKIHQVTLWVKRTLECLRTPCRNHFIKVLSTKMQHHKTGLHFQELTAPYSKASIHLSDIFTIRVTAGLESDSYVTIASVVVSCINTRLGLHRSPPTQLTQGKNQHISTNFLEAIFEYLRVLTNGGVYNEEQTKRLICPFIYEANQGYHNPKPPSTPLSFCISIRIYQTFPKRIYVSACQRVAKLQTIKVFKTTFFAILCSELLLFWSPAFNPDLQFCRPLVLLLEKINTDRNVCWRVLGPLCHLKVPLVYSI